MRKIILVILTLISISCLLFIRNSLSLDKHDLDCSKCHTLSKDEALNIIGKVIPDVKILEVNTSPVKGLWEVVVDSQGRKGLLYVDFSKKLAFNGSIFEISSNTNLTQKRFYEINKIDVSQIPLDDAILMGDKNAKYKVVVFSDPA